ncbi:MAG: hypothetical protein HDQ88_10385 [Clostridia bacterium]|nr:hypothetical protein [Clostridia bacterium]
METSDLIEMLSLIFTVVIAIVGGIFAYVQWQKAKKVRRAEFIEDIITNLRTKPSFVRAMNIFDYRTDWYNEDFHQSELEHDVDAFLSYLTYICYLRKMAILTPSEFKLLSYEIDRVCTNTSTRTYLWNIYHFAHSVGTLCSFEVLVKYMLENVMTQEEANEFKMHSEEESGYKDILLIETRYKFYETVAYLTANRAKK